MSMAGTKICKILKPQNCKHYKNNQTEYPFTHHSPPKKLKRHKFIKQNKSINREIRKVGALFVCVLKHSCVKKNLNLYSGKSKFLKFSCRKVSLMCSVPLKETWSCFELLSVRRK